MKSFDILVTTPNGHNLAFSDVDEEIVEPDVFIPWVCSECVVDDYEVPEGIWRVRASGAGSTKEDWAYATGGGEAVGKIEHPFKMIAEHKKMRTLDIFFGDYDSWNPTSYNPWNPPMTEDKFLQFVKKVETPKKGFWKFTLKDNTDTVIFSKRKFKF